MEKKFFSRSTILVLAFAMFLLPALTHAGISKGNENTPTCMADAVTARDSGLITAMNDYNKATTTGLQARLDGLKDAWSKYDSKNAKATKDAIRVVVSKYKTVVKDARVALKNMRVKAWSTYNTARLGCGVKFENTDSGLDSTL